MQARGKRVVVDLNSIVLSQQLSCQYAGIILGLDDGVGLRELEQRRLTVIILLVEHRDMLLLFIEV